jgi:molybdenum cofactor synthesis domain-containing protein
MELSGSRLVSKTGGKSSFPSKAPEGLKAAILVISDSAAAGRRADRSGRLIRERLAAYGVDEPELRIVPDEREDIAQELREFADQACHLVLTTGGTGLGPRDVTAAATREVLDREAPGIAEAMRNYGQRRTPYAMLSQCAAGIRGATLIVNLPGSTSGVDESLSAIFPALFHAFPIMAGGSH